MVESKYCLIQDFLIQIKESESLLKEYRDYKSSKERDFNENGQTNYSRFDRSEDQNQKHHTKVNCCDDDWKDNVDSPWNFSGIAYPRAKQPDIQKVDYEASNRNDKKFKPVILKPKNFKNHNEKANIYDYGNEKSDSKHKIYRSLKQK